MGASRDPPAELRSLSRTSIVACTLMFHESAKYPRLYYPPFGSPATGRHIKAYNNGLAKVWSLRFGHILLLCLEFAARRVAEGSYVEKDFDDKLPKKAEGNLIRSFWVRPTMRDPMNDEGLKLHCIRCFLGSFLGMLSLLDLGILNQA